MRRIAPRAVAAEAAQLPSSRDRSRARRRAILNFTLRHVFHIDREQWKRPDADLPICITFPDSPRLMLVSFVLPAITLICRTGFACHHDTVIRHRPALTAIVLLPEIQPILFHCPSNALLANINMTEGRSVNIAVVISVPLPRDHHCSTASCRDINSGHRYTLP